MEANTSKFYDVHKVFKKQLKARTLSPALQKFIECAVALAWKIACQQPTVLYKLFKTGEGQPFDERVQEAHAESDDPRNGGVFMYYVFPVLLCRTLPTAKILVKGQIISKTKK